jgi:hypothetical protein
MKFNKKNIIAVILMAIFLVKGMAGVISLFSFQLNGQSLIELVHSGEQEESNKIPESKHEGEPNEYFITHSFGTPDISFTNATATNRIHGSSAVQPWYGSVPTPPPDQA